MRPARNASRPASTPFFIARAMSTGSLAAAIAVFILYYVLLDRERLIKEVRTFLPLSDEEFERVGEVQFAVGVGVGLVQAFEDPERAESACGL